MTGFTVRTTSVEGRDDGVRPRHLYDDDRSPGEAKPIQASGYFLEIRRKQADGRWLIAVHMLNSHE